MSQEIEAEAKLRERPMKVTRLDSMSSFQPERSGPTVSINNMWLPGLTHLGFEGSLVLLQALNFAEDG